MSTSAFNQTGVDLPDPEPIQQAPAEEQPRPSWLPEKFKSEEDFANSYHELERRLTQEAQARAEAEAYAESVHEQWEAVSQQPQQQQFQQSPQYNPLLMQYDQARELGDTQTELALQAYVARQMAENVINERFAQYQNQQPDPAYNEMYAYTTDEQVRRQYEAKYGEAWDGIKQEVGQFLANGNLHWIEKSTNPSEAADKIMQAADYIRGQKLLAGQAQADNQLALSRQGKFLGQTLQGHGVRSQSAQSAADDLVERMKGLSKPYGYGA